MFLTGIHILQYKNYGEVSVSFENKFCLINGLNGSGKTNLIDAIHYLCMCKSYFTRSDLNVLNHGSEFFRLDGDFMLGDEKTSITCKFTKQKKEFLKNGVVYDKLSDHIGSIPVVMVAPDDIGIINDGSEERRRFLDAAIAQVNNIYLQRLITYNKILLQRNSLLKNFGNTEFPDETLLNVLSGQLAGHGDFIFEERKKYLDAFLPVFSNLYGLISEEKEIGSIEYISNLSMENHIQLLRESLREDINAQRTTTGIHKDDIRFSINENLLRDIGSQGQIKSFLIALKLAQFKMMYLLTGKKAILLLDDVFEKLDKRRLEILFKILSTEEFVQIFITDADEHRSVEFCEEHLEIFDHFNVVNGTIH
ncbi:MAG: DNA replication and repair protein RecF [Chitinophagales bacterium]|nr:DNA replication and repair protein RecF [Chitinophagales bacterium]